MKLIFLSLLLCGCSIVGPGERGIKVTLGSASDDAKMPGAYPWIPFISKVHTVDVQIQKTEVEAEGSSKDMQEVHTHVAVNWSIDPKEVVKTYTSIGDEADVVKRIIIPAVNEVFKAAMSKLTAEQILSERMKLKETIDEMLLGRLKNYGVVFNDLSIVNLTFSKDFSNAIEAKQIAEQRAQEAVYEARRATQTANAEVERAKGTAASQKLLMGSITPQILQKMAIDKWNGSFPQVMGSQTLPFLNIGAVK